MTQTQFLLLIISILPLINCAMIKLCEEMPKLVEIATKFMPVLFLINLIGLYGDIKNNSSYLSLTEAARGVSLGFAIDQMSLGYLFLLNFFWIIFVFYSQRFLKIIGVKTPNNLQIFFALIIALVNLIIISKNLLTILFFYNCLIILCHFFSVKFLHKEQNRFSHFFTFLLYLESIFFFLAIIATYKFTGQIDFYDGGIVSEKLSSSRYALLLTLYSAGLFLSVLFPCYLFYRNINLDPLIIYVLFFLAYGFSSLYILLKLLYFTFGLSGFSFAVSGKLFSLGSFIFLINIATVSAFLALSKGIKSSFFYLFFQQFIFALFAIFAFAKFDGKHITIASLSFMLSLTLVFLCIANFVLFLMKAEKKNLHGLFFDFKITSILFIFAIANLIGIAPGVGLIEKFFLVKIVFQERSLLTGLILIANFLGLAAFSFKIIWPLFTRDDEKRSEADVELLKTIDFDSSLILTAFVVAVAIALLLILFPLATNFLTV